METSGGPYLCGDYGLADAALHPFLERFGIALAIEGTVKIKELSSTVSDWMTHVEERASSRWASASTDKLKEAYVKHRSLDFFDYQTYEKWDLHPQNR